MIPYWSFTPAASFSYQDVSTGRSLALAHLKGHVVLVNMWATWCPPCVREMPSLQALHAEFHERGLVVLGVNVRDGQESVGGGRVADPARAHVCEPQGRR